MFRSISLIAICYIAFVNSFYLPLFPQSEGRIVGGEKAVLGQFPHQVSLRTTSNSHFCGGSILSNKWILTAAHCVVGRQPSSLTFVVGTIDRLNGGKKYNSINIFTHPNYSSLTNTNDVALIESKTEILFTDFIQPIQISDEIGGDVTVTASGWGATTISGSGGAPVNLQFLEIKTLKNEDCIERFSGTGAGDFVYDNNVCTTSPTGKGMCFGDSGGPIIFNNTLVGAVSWGIPCGKGYPDVFARISSHRSWIYSITEV